MTDLLIFRACRLIYKTASVPKLKGKTPTVLMLISIKILTKITTSRITITQGIMTTMTKSIMSHTLNLNNLGRIKFLTIMILEISTMAMMTIVDIIGKEPMNQTITITMTCMLSLNQLLKLLLQLPRMQVSEVALTLTTLETK